MPKPFAITAVPERVSLDNSRGGSTAFTVTNSSGKPLKAWPELKPLGSTKAGWLALEGGGEKPFSPNESQNFKVKLAVPKEAAAGRYEFKLNMISGTKGEEGESTEGPTVSFEVPNGTPPPPPPRKWLLYVVIAVILVGGIAAIVLLLQTPKVEVPDLSGKTPTEVSNKLSELKLIPSVQFKTTKTNKVGLVFDQDPKPKEKVAVSSAVSVMVESAPDFFPMPNLKGIPITAVKDSLEPKGLSWTQTGTMVTPDGSQPAGTIQRQIPEAGKPVQAGNKVELIVEGPSVVVPDLKTRALDLKSALNTLHASKLNVGNSEAKFNANPALQDHVVDQSPAPNVHVAEGTQVAIWLGTTNRGVRIIDTRLLREIDLHRAAFPRVTPH